MGEGTGTMIFRAEASAYVAGAMGGDRGWRKEGR